MHEEGSSGGNSVSTSGQDMTKTNTTVSCSKKFLPYGQNHPPASFKVSDQSVAQWNRKILRTRIFEEIVRHALDY